MDRAEKAEFVTSFKDIASSVSAMILVHYHGLTVQQSTKFRDILRNNNSSFLVVKNKLAKIALKDSGYDLIASSFSGPIGVVYSNESVNVAKAVAEFAKQNDKLKFVVGVIDNQIIDAKALKMIAELPSLDELRAKIIGLLNASATKLAGVIQAPASQLARVVSAYAEKK